MTDAYLIPTEAERLVIGQILTDHRLMTGAAQFLKPEHFGQFGEVLWTRVAASGLPGQACADGAERGFP